MASPAARVLMVTLALGCIALTTAQSYKLVNLQLSELATPATQLNVGTDFGSAQNFRNQIYDYNTGALLGHDQGQCVYTLPLAENGDYELECPYTFVLGEDSFSVLGQYTQSSSNLAVVGGTGAYSGATGVCATSTLSDDGNGTTVFGYNCQFYVLTPSIVLSPLAPKGQPAGAAPQNGVCDPTSKNPNQCFASGGKSSICCPGQCPNNPTNTAACA